MTDLGEKLGFELGQRILLLSPPKETAEMIKQLSPPGVVFRERVKAKKFDIILFWPRKKDGLDDKLFKLTHYIKPDGAIWAVLPRPDFAEKFSIDVNMDDLKKAASETVLEADREESFTEEEFGTRFVIRAELREHYR
jgi:hypothetical protein